MVVQPLTVEPDPGDQTPVFLAEELVQEGKTARIVLRDQVYILRVTKAGKLILTK